MNTVAYAVPAETDFLLHRQKHRHSRYLEEGGIFWSPEAKRWFVTRTDLIERILLDREAFAVPDYSARKLAARIGIDLEISDRLRAYLPNAHEGADHKRLRREITTLIVRNSDAALARFSQVLEKRLDGALDRPAFCFTQDVFGPALRAANLALVGFDGDDFDHLAELELLPGLFDDKTSLSRRRRIEGVLAAVMEARKAACEGSGASFDEDDFYLQLAALVLSINTLLASVTSSVLHLIQENAGRRLVDFDIPERFPVSGLPLIERVCRTDVVVEGRTISEGDQVRLLMEVFGDGPQGVPHHSDRYFAVGAHKCPGASYSNAVWRTIRDRLLRLDRGVELVEFRYREPDYVFNYLTRLSVRWI